MTRNILSMADIRSGVVKSAPSANAGTPKSEMTEKVDVAKREGLKEIEVYNNAFSEFKSKIGDLVLFEGLSASLESSINGVLIDQNMVHIIKGEPIPGLPEEDYAALRLSIFTSLIKKYT